MSGGSAIGLQTLNLISPRASRAETPQDDAHYEAAGHVGVSTDGAERTWKLWHWNDPRPYPKALGEREGFYSKRNGENWSGPRYGNRILSPGNWKYEYLANAPAAISERIHQYSKGHPGAWAGVWSRTEIFAPGGGAVTDLYNTADSVIAHLNIKTRKMTLIGSLGAPGLKDGDQSQAQLQTDYGDESPTIDRVTGRLFFRQQKSVLRYVEKLGRYRDTVTNKEYLLPALLDYKALYKELKSPAGHSLTAIEADPVFVVKSIGNLTNPRFPGPVRGKRVLLEPWGQGVYLSSAGEAWKPGENLLDKLSLETLPMARARKLRSKIRSRIK